LQEREEGHDERGAEKNVERVEAVEDVEGGREQNRRRHRRRVREWVVLLRHGLERRHGEVEARRQTGEDGEGALPEKEIAEGLVPVHAVVAQEGETGDCKRGGERDSGG